jgi:hypothetical protein
MNLRLFHVSTSESPITHFHPLAHFGSLASAIRCASSKAFKDLPKTLYEVQVTYPGDFVIAPDLSGALIGEVHTAGTIAQILGAGTWRSSTLPKAFLDGIVARAADYGPNPAAVDLVTGLKARGFNALTYMNRHDGQQADDWILLDPAALRIVHVARWSDPTAPLAVEEPVTMFEHWQVVLNAIVNARLFLIGQRRAVLPYADRTFNQRFWEAVAGLDESQQGLAAGCYVSSALLRKHVEEALALIADGVANTGWRDCKEAQEVADDLGLAIEHGMDNPCDTGAESLVRLRTPFVPLPGTAERTGQMGEPVAAF